MTVVIINLFTLNFPLATPPKASSLGPKGLLGEPGQLLSRALRLGNATRLGCRAASQTTRPG